MHIMQIKISHLSDKISKFKNECEKEITNLFIRRNGQFAERTPDGKFVITNYVHGKLHGIKEIMDKKGNILHRLHYVHGKLHGTEQQFTNNGKLSYSREWNNGKLLYCGMLLNRSTPKK